MDEPVIQQGRDDAAECRIYPELPNYVGNDEAFRAAVQAGLLSFNSGPTHDLPAVEAELRDIIHGRG